MPANLPLEGVRIVDLTANAAGPSCTQLLADFGADVIKVEPPAGDGTRSWGSSRFGPDGEFTPDFLSFNRNKRGVTVDLKAADERALILELVRDADVVVESFTPGVSARLGMGVDDLRRIKPDLIYCSLSGFGQTGPLRDHPAYDMLMQAFCGHMSITGEPARPSVRIGPSSIDMSAGALAAFGIVLALRHRDRTGEGQNVETSLFDAALYLISNHVAHHTATGLNPPKFGSQFPLIAPYGVFQAADRELFIGISTDGMWSRFCDAIGRHDLAADQRFASNGGRVEHIGELVDVLTPVLRSDAAAHWLQLCEGLHIPVSLVQTMEELASHPQTSARDALIDTGVDGIRVVGCPVHLSQTPAVMRRPAPRLGEDNDLLRAEAGASAIETIAEEMR